MTDQIDELNARSEQEAEQHGKEIEELNEQIAKLTQELKDKQVENRIAGKKGDQLVSVIAIGTLLMARASSVSLWGEVKVALS